MKHYKNGRTVFSGDDIAAAFNRPLPSTKCANCPHSRSRHHRTVVKPGMFDGIEAFGRCEKRDRRTKNHLCKCEQWIEPADDHATDHLKENHEQ